MPEPVKWFTIRPSRGGDGGMIAEIWYEQKRTPNGTVYLLPEWAHNSGYETRPIARHVSTLMTHDQAVDKLVSYA